MSQMDEIEARIARLEQAFIDHRNLYHVYSSEIHHGLEARLEAALSDMRKDLVKMGLQAPDTSE